MLFLLPGFAKFFIFSIIHASCDPLVTNLWAGSDIMKFIQKGKKKLETSSDQPLQVNLIRELLSACFGQLPSLVNSLKKIICKVSLKLMKKH